MSEAWYRSAGAGEPLTQGDIVFEARRCHGGSRLCSRRLVRWHPIFRSVST